MAFTNEIQAWATKYGTFFVANIAIIQLATGALLIYLGYSIGIVHFDLIMEGTRTQGLVIAFKEEHYEARSGTGTTMRTALLPIVEFQAARKSVRFKDWKGTNGEIQLNELVPILYKANQPSVAMIDRPVWNWMPWAPIFGLGCFLCLVGVKGWIKKQLVT